MTETQQQLGRMEPVDLRVAWITEDRDFTRSLSVSPILPLNSRSGLGIDNADCAFAIEASAMVPTNTSATAFAD